MSTLPVWVRLEPERTSAELSSTLLRRPMPSLPQISGQEPTSLSLHSPSSLSSSSLLLRRRTEDQETETDAAEVVTEEEEAEEEIEVVPEAVVEEAEETELYRVPDQTALSS